MKLFSDTHDTMSSRSNEMSGETLLYKPRDFSITASPSLEMTT